MAKTVVLSVTLATEFRDRLKRAAEVDRRTMSQWAFLVLEEAVAAWEARRVERQDA